MPKIPPTSAADAVESSTKNPRSKNLSKSRILARVVHVFGVIKCLWRFGKVHHRRLKKNAARAFTAFAVASTFLSR